MHAKESEDPRSLAHMLENMGVPGAHVFVLIASLFVKNKYILSPWPRCDNTL